MFENCRLAKMSDGHYCFVRDLGLVKGGKGMKHHEVIVDFNRRGIVELIKRGYARLTGNARPNKPVEEEARLQPDPGSSVAT